MLAGAGKNLLDSLGVCARAFGPWLTIAIGLVVATTMFGCSQQPTPQYQYSSSVPSRISPSVRPPGKLEVASWYGPGFVGHVTSDGEVFSPNELTAASKTLPLGSRVRVTNPENGRSVVVRINDRGPYIKGRNLDLSHSAAQKIGLCAEGVGHVRVTVLRRTPM
jgi:rare lipoprotein A